MKLKAGDNVQVAMGLDIIEYVNNLNLYCCRISGTSSNVYLSEDDFMTLGAIKVEDDVTILTMQPLGAGGAGCPACTEPKKSTLELSHWPDLSVDKNQNLPPKKCECGASSVGSNKHSYCPLAEPE